ncbi:hypothetical protein OHD60_11805 [Escherichia coli]|nr:hypothetical protein [Escherichia coli]
MDDDQGIFVMCYYKRPDLFNLNYLGERKMVRFVSLLQE